MIVPDGLTIVRHDGGVVFALCACGKTFRAAGSHGVCEFMRREIRKHTDECEELVTQ